MNQVWIAEGLPVGLALSLFFLGFIALFFLHARSLRMRPGLHRFFLVFLRLAAWSALIWICVLPTVQEQSLEAVPPRIAVVLDSSVSMDQPWPEKGKSSHQLATEALASLTDTEVQIERFSFASGLSRGWDLKGVESRLYSALADLQDQQAGAELKGIILLSDGRATDPKRLIERTPIYAIPLGPAQSNALHVEIQPLPTEMDRGAKLAFEGHVIRSGPDAKTATVRVWQEQSLLAEQSVSFPEAEDRVRFHIELPYTKEGLAAFRVDATTPQNNVLSSSAYLATRILQTETHILLICARPGQECAFLRRQLGQEEGLSITQALGLPEHRLWMDGQTLEQSGGLDVSKYNAILAIGSESLAWLPAELPDFVRKGGGLFLLLDERSEALDGPMWPWIEYPKFLKQGAFPAKVNPEAENHTLLSVLQEFQEGSGIISGMPSLGWGWIGGRWKEAAQVLLQFKVDGAWFPLLVSHRHGQGRVAVWTAGEIWNWRFQPVALDTGKEEVYVRLMPRLARWLATGNEFERFSLKIKAQSLASPVSVKVTAFNEDYTPAEGHEVQLELRPLAPAEPALAQLQTRLVISAAGSAEWSTFLGHPGIYQATARFENGEIQRVGLVAVNWPHGELGPATVNQKMLEELATSTKGRILSLDQLPGLLQELGANPGFKMVFEKKALWSSGWLLALTIGLLVGEWALRRFWRLP